MKKIHLVGSVPLADSAETFTTVCNAIGPHLNRIPDGETGERGGWISFQHTMLEKHPAVMLNPAGRTVPIRDLEGGVSRENNLFVLRNPDEVPDFLPLGYASAAIDSYAVFKQLRDAGTIPQATRFQVCMPTPFATGLLYFHPDSQEKYIGYMKEALLAEVAEICAAIPHKDLAIQWDCCQEILLLEGYFPDDWRYDASNMPPTVGELGDAVPTEVELGHHFCYGSPVDAPLVKQDDMGVVVGLVNAVSAETNRPINFMHLPVSAPTADETFFAPLANLAVGEQTEIYLGLLHPKDPSNDQKRIAAAQAILPDFGVATECGWGRKQPEIVPQVLAVHEAAVAAA